ncbi:MAG: hypothetical protein AAF992_10765 [Bacteroidota bacterium]
MRNKGISDSIQDWQLTIDAARADATITKELAKQGYNADRMTEGVGLVSEFKEQQQAYQQAIGDQCGATDALQLAQETANATYIFHVKIARLAIPKDRDLWRTLQLNGIREKSLNGWLEQTESFYNNLPEALPLMKNHGVTAVSIEQAKEQIQAVRDARVSQTHRKGATQISKQQRDETLARLEEWMEDFIRTAKFVYAKNPQQLESLGISVG